MIIIDDVYRCSNSVPICCVRWTKRTVLAVLAKKRIDKVWDLVTEKAYPYRHRCRRYDKYALLGRVWVVYENDLIFFFRKRPKSTFAGDPLPSRPPSPPLVLPENAGGTTAGEDGRRLGACGRNPLWQILERGTRGSRRTTLALPSRFITSPSTATRAATKLSTDEPIYHRVFPRAVSHRLYRV